MEVNLKNNNLQTSSIKTDALLNSVHNTPYYVDMPGHMAFLASKIPSLKICKSAERVPNTLLLEIKIRQIGRTGWTRKFAIKNHCFWKSLCMLTARWTAGHWRVKWQGVNRGFVFAPVEWQLVNTHTHIHTTHTHIHTHTTHTPTPHTHTHTHTHIHKLMTQTSCHLPIL